MSEGAAPWTVLTWNVHGSGRPDLDAVADRIAAESPDVVALQEIRRSQASALAHSLSMRYSWAFKHHPYTPAMWWLAEGMSIMSPHALDAAGHTELSEGRSSWSWRRRIAHWALVGRRDGSAVRIYNLHLSPHDAPAARRAEAVRLASIVAEHGTDPPAIVAGDFNDAGDPAIVFALPGIEHVTPSHTNPAHAPDQLLDHVLLPPEAHDVAVTVPAGGAEWAVLSDHLPVTVRFAL
jgi:endonuclease/exonuclease/phosphatase family metal-dependent hydrolase